LRAWRATIPGQLEEHLHRLVRCYTIFTFYGSGYDHVLLLSHLVPRLFELGFRPRIERKGNRVTTIRARGGVVFRDVTKLLAPSMNLRKFGQLFGFEQEKAHFPFSLLSSVADLGRESLPSEATDPAWRSELTSSSPSQAEVDEALRLYRAAHCSNLGDYLRAYLKLDVDILQRATVCWKATLFSLISLDFVDAGRFTISSLSYEAGLRISEKNRRIGSFFPNNSQHYRILRRGMRGGLCSVYRSVAGGSDCDKGQQQERLLSPPWFFASPHDPSDVDAGNHFASVYSNNSHLLSPPPPPPPNQEDDDDDDDDEKLGRASRFVGYYDAASLYPSSGENLSLFFCSHSDKSGKKSARRRRKKPKGTGGGGARREEDAFVARPSGRAAIFWRQKIARATDVARTISRVIHRSIDRSIMAFLFLACRTQRRAHRHRHPLCGRGS